MVKIKLISPAAEENTLVPSLARPILAALPSSDVKITFTNALLTPNEKKLQIANL